MSQRSIERYCLRLQLHLVLGATGYEDLTTIDEEVHPTFLAAAVSSGLLEVGAELSKAMEEAALFKFGFDLRRLFVNRLIFDTLLDPLSLSQACLLQTHSYQFFFFRQHLIESWNKVSDEAAATNRLNC